MWHMPGFMPKPGKGTVPEPFVIDSSVRPRGMVVVYLAVVPSCACNPAMRIPTESIQSAEAVFRPACIALCMRPLAVAYRSVPQLFVRSGDGELLTYPWFEDSLHIAKRVTTPLLPVMSSTMLSVAPPGALAGSISTAYCSLSGAVVPASKAFSTKLS